MGARVELPGLQISTVKFFRLLYDYDMRNRRQKSRAMIVPQTLPRSQYSWGSRQRDLIARGVFESRQILARKIMRYIRHSNKAAVLFRWVTKILPSEYDKVFTLIRYSALEEKYLTRGNPSPRTI